MKQHSARRCCSYRGLWTSEKQLADGTRLPRFSNSRNIIRVCRVFPDNRNIIRQVEVKTAN